MRLQFMPEEGCSYQRGQGILCSCKMISFYLLTTCRTFTYIHAPCSAQKILSASALCVSGAGNHCLCLASAAAGHVYTHVHIIY